jgi:TolA-binding protein
VSLLGKIARALIAAAPLLASACAGAPLRGSGGDSPRSEVAELQGQLKAQSALLADQQRRIEQLEVRLAGLAGRLNEKAKPAAVPTEVHARPAEGVPKQLKTVKMEAPKGRRVRRSPSERTPPSLPTVTNLKEPQEAELERLHGEGEAARPSRSARFDPGRDAALADVSFAQAVQKLNEGDGAGAQADLLMFAAKNPQHAAADNAIYLAGVASVQAGRCEPALGLFERVWGEYPAGDAVPGARLEHARCLLRMGQGDGARAELEALEKDHPDVPEATQARALLNGL